MFPASLIPDNEAQRLQALAPYRVLGTAPDAVFDEVVRLTAKIFDVPVALVSLVDERSVLFKANYGLAGAQQTARDESSCSVAILQEETTVLEDLRETPCDLLKPGVPEALQLRFYAGHPLHDPQGYPIGALCVIDRQPRPFDLPEKQRLQELADIVTRMLQLRLAIYDKPTLARETWVRLYDHLDASLTRLDTLAELKRWEEFDHTPSALAYQHSREEEKQLVVRRLAQQVDKALAAIS